MIGNGPFMLDEPRTDQEIVLVPNPEWDGTKYDEALGLPDEPYLERSPSGSRPTPTPRTTRSRPARATPPTSRRAGVRRRRRTTRPRSTCRSSARYHFEINWDDPVVGGDENMKLRQAISQAIDREEINEAVYDGTRTTSTGITPKGIPGFAEGLCEYCAYDPEAAAGRVRRVDGRRQLARPSR